VREVKKNGDGQIPLFNRLLLECKEISKLVTHSLDEPLTLRQRLRVRWHLFVCVYCRRFQKQVFWIRKILQGKSKPSFEMQELSEAHLSKDARERIKKVLKEKIDADKQS
jgi:hypothetical protein